jgi:hypothetical protein
MRYSKPSRFPEMDERTPARLVRASHKYIYNNPCLTAWDNLYLQIFILALWRQLAQ